MKLLVLYGLLYVVTKEVLAVLKLKGTVNEQLSIFCDHSWASTNVKYFCTWFCTEKGVLIRSKGVGMIAKNGRYSLYDRGQGRFTVNITGLKKSDTGRYWCGVERSGADTFQEVSLVVLDGPQVTTTPPTLPGRKNSILAYVFVLLLIVVLSPAIYYTWKKTHSIIRACFSSNSHEAAGRENNTVREETSPGDQNTVGIYENLEPSIVQSNPVYQMLCKDTTQSHVLYDSLPSQARHIPNEQSGNSLINNRNKERPKKL